MFAENLGERKRRKKLYFPLQDTQSFVPSKRPEVTSLVENSRYLNSPGVGGRAGILWENHLAPGGEHLAGPLCPHGHALASPDKGQPVLVAAGVPLEEQVWSTGQGGKSWQPQDPVSALGLFLCSEFWGQSGASQGDSAEVWGKNTLLGYPRLNPTCGFSLPCGREPDPGMEREREKIDPKPRAVSSLL